MKFMHALALSGAAFCLTACQFETTSDPSAPIWAREQSIEAIGRATVEMMPNHAEFSADYRGQAPTAEAASAEAQTKANLAVDAIREIGGENVRIRSSINIRPYYEQVRVQVREDVEQLQENVHPDALLGYVATANVSVSTDDLENVGQMRGAALLVGPSRAGQVRFSLSPNVEAMRVAFEAAVADAQARAEITASISGDQLGGLLVLREGVDTCLGQIYGAPGQDLSRSDRVVVTGSRIGRSEFTSVSPSQMITGGVELGLMDVDDIVEAAQGYVLASDFEPQEVSASVCAIYAVE